MFTFTTEAREQCREKISSACKRMLLWLLLFLIYGCTVLFTEKVEFTWFAVLAWGLMTLLELKRLSKASQALKRINSGRT